MGYEFFGEKIIFPSAPVPGINNDQSLTSFGRCKVSIERICVRGDDRMRPLLKLEEIVLKTESIPVKNETTNDR